VSLGELYWLYGEDVQFLAVYLREAHPIEGWWLGGGLFGLVMRFRKSRAATDLHDPKTMEQRRHAAGRCESELQYGIPTLVDDMADSVNRAYAAMPTRLYLIGVDGLVKYAGGLGPWGFKPPELKAAIETLLCEPASLSDLPRERVA
jgi:hypothetical protein